MWRTILKHHCTSNATLALSLMQPCKKLAVMFPKTPKVPMFPKVSLGVQRNDAKKQVKGGGAEN